MQFTVSRSSPCHAVHRVTQFTGSRSSSGHAVRRVTQFVGSRSSSGHAVRRVTQFTGSRSSSGHAVRCVAQFVGSRSSSSYGVSIVYTEPKIYASILPNKFRHINSSKKIVTCILCISPQIFCLFLVVGTGRDVCKCKIIKIAGYCV